MRTVRIPAIWLPASDLASGEMRPIMRLKDLEPDWTRWRAWKKWIATTPHPGKRRRKP